MDNSKVTKQLLEVSPTKIPTIAAKNMNELGIPMQLVTMEVEDLVIFNGKLTGHAHINRVSSVHEVTHVNCSSFYGTENLLWSLNRMNDIVPNNYAKGQILLKGEDIIEASVCPEALISYAR